MGRFDILDKRFFEDRKRFAELVNREIYHGREVLVPEHLEPLKRKYPSLMTSSGEYEHQIREIHKGHMSRKGYQDYRDKKSRMKEDDFLMPTVTMVLYLGEGHWEGRIRLKDMFRIPEAVEEQLDGLLRDYGFPLLEAEAIEYEKYHTDLREFFQAMQCRRDKERLRELLQLERFRKLGRETEQVIAAHLNNSKVFEKVEEGMSVCKAMEDICMEEREIGRKQGKAEGIAEGKAEGIEVGKMQERLHTMQRMLQSGLAEDLILNILDCTKEELAAAVAGR